MAINSNSIAPPTLAKRTVDVPGIGEVIVRGGLGSEKIALYDRARDGNLTDHMAALLACACINPDGSQFWTSEQWDIWTGQHLTDAVGLYSVARELWGMDAEAAEKKSEHPGGEP